MGHSDFASQNTYHLFTALGEAGAKTIAGGGTIRVFGFIFTATTDNETVFTMTDASNTALFTFTQLKNSIGGSSPVWVCFLADAGLKVQSSRDDGSVTVFHNAPGS